MAFKRSNLARSAKTSAASLARSTRRWPSVIAEPNSRRTSSYAGCPGSITLCARESASSTENPSSRSMAATALLPLAIPPVSPSRNIALSPRRRSRRRGRELGRTATKPRGLNRIAHQHGDGHWTDPARNGRERTSRVDCVGLDVADQDSAFGVKLLQARREIPEKLFRLGGILDRVGADVDDCSSGLAICGGLDPIGLHETRFAHRGDDDVRAPHDFGKITRLGMADCDGGVGVHEQERHRLANNVAPAKNNGVRTLNGNVAAAQNFHASRWRAGDETRASADETAEVYGMKAVHVFGGIDRFENALGIDLRRKRKLDEDAVYVVVAIQPIHDGEKRLRGDACGRRVKPACQPNLFAGSDFALHIELGRGILSNENRGKSRTQARGGQMPNFFFQFGEYFIAYFQSIENARGHQLSL